MTEKYQVRSTSSKTAKVEDRTISTTATTRKIIRPELVDNPNDTVAKVKITLLHQRKGKNDSWEDVQAVSLASLKAQEWAKMPLDTSETLALHKELTNLFKIFEDQGIPYGETNLVVGIEDEIIKTDPSRAKVISALLKQGHSEEVWKELINSDPDLATKLSHARIHQERAQALKEFETNIGANNDENFWQKFFESNPWVLGYGLRYCFLSQIQARPHLGGTDATGANSQFGDFLHKTEANHKFTLLVEIKTPSTPLLSKTKYRSHTYPPHSELSGGVSQLQASCRTWEREGSKSEQNQELLASVNTVLPNGILVIGNTQELMTNDHRVSFEVFRRNLANPEIVTFDELLERARYIVMSDGQRIV